MTVAVCFRCGVLKFGAFCPCGECAALPRTEDELALSLAMTDHYFDRATLEQMGAAVKEGKTPHLSPETREGLIEMIHNSGMVEKLKEMLEQTPDAEKSQGSGGDPELPP